MQRRNRKTSAKHFAAAPLETEEEAGGEYAFVWVVVVIAFVFVIVGIVGGIGSVIFVAIRCTKSVQCANLECGIINLCGTETSCGTCDIDGWTCVDHVCNCTYPTSCNVSYECGTEINNCGDAVECGTCDIEGWTCVDNMCNCTYPNPCNASYDCGTEINNCGDVVACGTCNTTDGWTCIGNMCNCTYPTSCSSEGYLCGNFTNNCGDELFCGLCITGMSCVNYECQMDPWVVGLTDNFKVDSGVDRVYPAGTFTDAVMNLRNADQSIVYNVTRVGTSSSNYVTSYDFGGTAHWVAKFACPSSTSSGTLLIQVVDNETLLVGYSNAGVSDLNFYDADDHTTPSHVHSSANITTKIILGIRTITTNGTWLSRTMYIDGNVVSIYDSAITDESNYSAFFYSAKLGASGTMYFHAVDGTVDFTFSPSATLTTVTVKGNIVTGHWEWVAWLGSGSGAIYPRVFQSSEQDGSVITGVYSQIPVSIYNLNGSYIANVSLTSEPTMVMIVKYGSHGSVEWFTKVGRIQDSGYGSGTDDGIDAYVCLPAFDQGAVRIYDAGDPPVLAASVGVGYNEIMIKFNLSNGVYQWAAKTEGIARTGTALPFAMLSLPDDKVLYPAYAAGTTSTHYNSDGTAGVVVKRPTNGAIISVAYSTNGTVTYPAYSFQPTTNSVRAVCSTGDNIFFNDRFLSTAVIPTYGVYDGLTNQTFNLSDSLVPNYGASLIALRLTF